MKISPPQCFSINCLSEKIAFIVDLARLKPNHVYIYAILFILSIFIIIEVLSKIFIILYGDKHMRTRFVTMTKSLQRLALYLRWLAIASNTNPYLIFTYFLFSNYFSFIKTFTKATEMKFCDNDETT